MYATGQFTILLETGLPLEGLQFALIMYALLSVIFIGLSLRMNFALTCVFTSIALAYLCLAIGFTHDQRRVTKVLALPPCLSYLFSTSQECDQTLVSFLLPL